jgi:hypothetical protein
MLAEKQRALQDLPSSVTTEAEAMIEFLRIKGERTRLMEGLMVRGERDIFTKDDDMLYPYKLHSMFVKFEEDLRGAASTFLSKDYRSKVEKAMMGSSGIALANFLSHPVFKEVREMSAPTFLRFEV